MGRGLLSKQNSWDWIARGFRLAHKHISRRLFPPGAGPCVGSKKKEPHPHIVQFRQQVVGHLAVVSFILLSQIFCFHLVCFAFCFRKQNGEKLTFVCWLWVLAGFQPNLAGKCLVEDLVADCGEHARPSPPPLSILPPTPPPHTHLYVNSIWRNPARCLLFSCLSCCIADCIYSILAGCLDFPIYYHFCCVSPAPNKQPFFQ